MKGIYRVTEKGVFKYNKLESVNDVQTMRLGKVRDLVRGGIIHETMRGLCRVLDYFHKSDAVTVVRIKNRFETPSDAGWTDCMLNFYFRDDPHRHVCEVQLIHHKMFSQRTVQDGHDGYNIFRSSYELLAYHGNLPGQRKMSTVRSASVRRALKTENFDGDDFIMVVKATPIQKCVEYMEVYFSKDQSVLVWLLPRRRRTSQLQCWSR